MRAAARDRSRTLHRRRSRAGTLPALGKEHLPIGEAVGFEEEAQDNGAFGRHRLVPIAGRPPHELRQTRSELLLSPVPRCRRGILALIN